MAAGLSLVAVLLADRPAHGKAFPPRASLHVARADSDSTVTDFRALETGRLALSDTTRADSLVAARRVDRYLAPLARRPSRRATLFPRRSWPLAPPLGAYWQQDVQLDSTGRQYLARTQAGGGDVRLPVAADRDAYRQARLTRAARSNFRDLSAQRSLQRRQEQRSGLGLNITVPGGRRSAFTTIFGKNEVDLRINGQADIRAAFDYRKSDQQVAITGTGSSIDPDFKQDLTLGITGTIGDKLRLDINWDTQRDFDYQNQLKLQYTGYEDEIIQSVEAGNVFLQTPSSLIRGGQSLFGIKGEFQLGNLRLTTVASQQEGQSNSLSISGGAETTTFDFRPTDYDENAHFFLGYYFRNNWEPAHAEPERGIVLSDGFERVTEVELWKLERIDSEDDGVSQVVAVVDLGEPAELLTDPTAFTTPVLPSDQIDQYQDADVTGLLRPGDVQPPRAELEARGLTSSDYEFRLARKLEEGRDYRLDDRLGYVSLQTSLQENEGLAVAFRYRTTNGQAVQVGDFSSEFNTDGRPDSDRLVLKLLRPSNPRAPEGTFNPAAWYLELRNIYRLGRGVQSNEFELSIDYEPPGESSTRTLPGVTGTQTLLEVLGLDRLTQQGARQPDNVFDYLPDYTIDPAEGLLIFPYLEPFGQRIADLIGENLSGPAQDEAIRTFVFTDLYRQKQEIARIENPGLDVYRIQGSYQGSAQGFYELGAFAGLVDGSVRVTSGGVELTEGTDYVVDYQGGAVTITNDAYLADGSDIAIDYEQNALVNLQKKTLLGARLDYQLSDQIGLGATVMRLSQRSLTDKFRVGEEPIANTIWGLDGTMNLEPRWLTRGVDALPFIQTREPSAISLTAEVAQLRPGHTQPPAFEDTRDRLQTVGRDLSADQLSGLSYIEDFEGFESPLALDLPNRWKLSTAPDSLWIDDPNRVDRPPVGLEELDAFRTTWRGMLAWYQLNEQILEDLGADEDDPRVALVPTELIFPGRDREDLSPSEQEIRPLDLYFSPHERGPYNYTADLRTFLANPQDVWGGITQALPERYVDFSLNGVEFVEFIVQAFSENEGGDAGPDAKLYIDLGQISEDVLPNARLNSEDGLSLRETPREGTLDAWGRRPSSSPDRLINIDEGSRRSEDVGLDGVASYRDNQFGPEITEAIAFQDFLNTLSAADPDPRYQAEAEKARRDPSGDDYYHYEDDYFNDPALYPEGAPVQARFSRYYAGLELNTRTAQNSLGNGSRREGNTNDPDDEDLNANSAIDVDNQYFQYEVPLSKTRLDSLAQPDRTDDYVVGRIAESRGDGTGWYLVRIPVREYTRRVGGIQDFSRIEALRVWTTGHSAPATLRFATFDLVGSQWRAAEEVHEERRSVLEAPGAETRLFVESVNNEENRGVYVSPLGAVVSQIQNPNTGQLIDAREQSLVLRVDNLYPGQQRAVSKTFAQPFDLLKYQNLRMFTHLHGRLRDGRALEEVFNANPDEGRNKVRLFVRLGANETGDYYEYEQPLTPTSVVNGGNSADRLWRTNESFNGQQGVDLNSMNVLLRALNQLKFVRDESGAITDSVFWNDENGVELNPSVASFAPPGTRLAVRGTPSLQRVNTIVIGVRNAADSSSALPSDILDEAVVWVNELRVSGYDERSGWAGLVDADVKLADLGRVRANFQFQTDGFGSLSSTLGDREQRAVRNWSIRSEVNANKVLPERYGWSIPVSLQFTSNTETPRFDPNRGDVRVQELVDALEAREDLTEEERAVRRDRIVESSQTDTYTRSFSGSIRKQSPGSPLLQKTVDGLSYTLSYTDSEGRTPTLQESDRWGWNTTLGYRVGFQRPHTIKPFWFLGFIPVVGAVGDLRFNYLPQSVSLSGSASRRYSQTQERAPYDRLDLTDENLLAIEYPRRELHTFTHNRNFGLQYNPFEFLNLSFDTNTDQSLSDLGADTLSSVIVTDSARTRVEQIFPDVTLDEAVAQGLVDPAGATAFQTTELDVLPLGQVVNRLFAGEQDLRTERYLQRFTGTFRPTFLQTEALDWFDLQDVVYNVEYSWLNGSLGSNTGAYARNDLTINSGVTFRPVDVWRKFGFYRALEEQQEEAAARRRARRAERERRRDADEDEAEQEAEDDAAERPPFNPLHLLRRVFLGVTGVRDLQVTYSGLRSSGASNVGRPELGADGNVLSVSEDYSLLDALRGEGPSFGYRFGLERRIGLSQRVLTSDLRVLDELDNQNQFQGRATLAPGRSLQVSLNWQLEWSNRAELTYSPLVEGGFQTTEIESGSVGATVWAFGGSYRALFERQLETFRADARLAPDTATPVSDLNGDGRVALTNQSTVEDFRAVFGTGLGDLDRRNLLPFPLPNWSVNYTGISNWPLLRRLTESATLRHGYSAEYSATYATNTSGSAQEEVVLGERILVFAVPDFETNSILVNERYQPALGLDLTWGRAFQTRLDWNESNSYALVTTNSDLRESTTSELAVQVTYQKQGLRIPFLPGRRINNRITLELAVSRSTTDEQRYLLSNALAQAVSSPGFGPDQALEEDFVQIITSTKRLQIAPRIAYQFSNRVSADFFLTYERFDDARLATTVTTSGGFNVSVNISS